MSESNTRKAIHGMSSQTIVTIVLGIVEVISFSIMSRLLSQEDFGYYAAITAITTIFASFSETGIGSAIIQRKKISDRFINNSFTISLIFGSILMFILFMLARPLSIIVADSSMAIPLMLMSVTLLCNCLSSVNISIMYRRLKFIHVGLINLLSLVITTAIAIIFAIYGLGYYAIIAKAVLTSIITLVVSWVMVRTKFSLALDRQTVNDIFGFSGWLMASVFFRNFAQQVDKLMMTKLLSASALGTYNRPKDFIAQISGKFGNIFDTALFPVLSQLQDNHESLKNAYLKSMYLLNMASVVLAMGFIFNGELIIKVFFGAEWINVLPVFIVLSIAIIFNFDARLADCYMRSMALTKCQFLFRIIEVLFKIIGLLLAYKWGIMGIAVSVLITDLIAILLKHLYIANKLKIKAIDTISILVKSWKVCIVISPIMICLIKLSPSCIMSNILVLCVFVLFVIVSFVFFPSIIGDDYKKMIYPKLIDVINIKLYKK